MARENILLDRQDRIWFLTFNRPDKRNALDARTVAECHDALAEVEREAGPGVAVVILQGAGDKAFVSGADIAQLKKRTQLDALYSINQGLFTAVENFPWPTIAAVHGFALGGGFELALSCDLRVASEAAQFGFPETGLGIIPGAGGTQRLTWLVGMALAKELILTGDRIDARRALQAGVVSAVVPPDQLRATAVAYGERILSRGPLAVRMAKLAMNASAQAPLHAGLLIERMAQAICFESEDKAEGTGAFLEKRKPRFQGR